jgi:flavin-dependent dehydrogenase
MKSEIESDVCVLGAGPAGSIAAMRLAQLGHKTVLVGRTNAINRRPESLAPSILPILQSLDIRDIIDPAVINQEERALLLWNSGAIQEKRYGAPSLLVDRVLFDKLLRDMSSRFGVQVYAPATARAPERLRCGRWHIPMTTPDGPSVIRAKFLVDARGKRRRTRATEGAPRTAAISSSWALADRSFAETRIEAGVEEWFWGSFVPECFYTATVFLDPARVVGLDRTRRSDLYRSLLSRSKLLKGLLRGEMLEPVHVRDASIGIASDDLIGRDFIRLGEAAFSIDPLSSQGVQAAMLSATQGSAAVHTILSPQIDPVPAMEFYRDRQRKAVIQGSRNAAHLYSLRSQDGIGSFWIRRSVEARVATAPERRDVHLPIGLPSYLRRSESLQIIEVPILNGALIERASALSHPSLENPIAFLCGIALVPLVEATTEASETDEILRRWIRRMKPEIAWNIMHWMYAVGILVSDENVTPGPSSTL